MAGKQWLTVNLLSDELSLLRPANSVKSMTVSLCCSSDEHVRSSVQNMSLKQCNYNEKFWSEIEAEVKETIPDIIKIVTAHCGYDRRMCFQNLTKDDILDMENHINQNCADLAKRWTKKGLEYSQGRDAGFHFLPGHAKLILALSHHVSDGASFATSNARTNTTATTRATAEKQTKAKMENDDRPRSRLRKSEWRFGGLSTHIVKSHPPDSANFDSEFDELEENGCHGEATSISNGRDDDSNFSNTSTENEKQSPFATENTNENTNHSPVMVNVKNKEPAIDLNNLLNTIRVPVALSLQLQLHENHVSA